MMTAASSAAPSLHRRKREHAKEVDEWFRRPPKSAILTTSIGLHRGHIYHGVLFYIFFSPPYFEDLEVGSGHPTDEA